MGKEAEKVNVFVHIVLIWSNYSDLTRPHTKWQGSRGTPQQMALCQENLGW